MAKFIPVGTFDIVIFGATGDLSERKLLPALFHRWLDGQIPDGSRVVGSARTAMSVDDFREFAKSACQSKAEDKWDENDWARFAERQGVSSLPAYQQHEAGDCDQHIYATPMIDLDL